MSPDQRQNSFIPKTDSFQTSGGNQKRSGGSYFILGSLALAIIAVLLSVGLFFYKQSVQSTLAEKQQQLEQARSGFDAGLIESLSDLDNRISTARELLNEHITFTPIFPIIESTTLTSVSFNSMEITHSESSGGSADSPSGNSNPGSVTVNLSGTGPGYPAIALQSSELADHDQIRNPVLSDFSLNNEGNVEFSVQFSIPEEEILFTSTNISNL
jgi:hypothetical protein